MAGVQLLKRPTVGMGLALVLKILIVLTKCRCYLKTCFLIMEPRLVYLTPALIGSLWVRAGGESKSMTNPEKVKLKNQLFNSVSLKFECCNETTD